MVSTISQDAIYHINILLQNICEENEFVVGIFYALITLEDKSQYMTAKDQPFHINSEDKSLKDFIDQSIKAKFTKGNDNIGRVWKSEEHEWIQNVQHLSSEAYSRKQMAKEKNLQSCLSIAYVEDDSITGVMEFYLQEEWIEIPKMIEKIKYYVQNFRKQERRQTLFELIK